jgi:uncharacterized repeat protein (TIGR03847 family)
MIRMPRRLFLFDEPDRFLAVALGAPGKRTFLLQAGQGRAVVTLGIEKVQVAALAARIHEVLGNGASSRPSAAPEEPWASAPAEPLVAVFRVGAIALGWDPQVDMMLVEARAAADEGDYTEVGDEDPDGPDLLRVRLTASQASLFATAASAVVKAGRPPCPYCGEPLEASGHFCARSSGTLN